MNTIPDIIDDIRNGKMVILVDDEDRENEGDLICAADFITPDLINFMITEARGLVCLSLAPEQIERLGLPMMIKDEANFSPNKNGVYRQHRSRARNQYRNFGGRSRAHDSYRKQPGCKAF